MNEQPRFGFPPEPPAGAVVEPQRVSLLGILSLITGLLALPVCCLPIAGSVFGLVPMALGFGGLIRIRRSSGRIAGRGLAIAGIVLGAIGAGASTFAWIGFGQALSSMPSIYAQVLDEDPAIARTVLTSSTSATLTDEEITAFHRAFVAAHGENWTAPKGLLPLAKGYMAASDPQPLRDVSVGAGQSPVPLPIEVDGGWAYLIVVLQQGQNLGSGMPALADAAFVAADGSTVVWLRGPSASPDTSPVPAATDDRNQAPPPDPGG